jgi:hypothetical protein
MIANGRNGHSAPLAMVLALGLALAGCSHKNADFQRSPDAPPEAAGESIFGKGGIGINLFGHSKTDGSEGAVAVNAFLWRASLDTLSFMPLTSEDPFGGVIISDWYAPPEAPDERFKVTVYILGRALRADGLKVQVFRQTRNSGGQWTDTPVTADVGTEFEDAILGRARQLHLQAVAEK